MYLPGGGDLWLESQTSAKISEESPSNKHVAGPRGPYAEFLGKIWADMKLFVHTNHQ